MEVKTDLPAPAWVWKEPSRNLLRIVEGKPLYPEQGQGLYSAEQIRAFGESCARMAREEAAKLESDALRYRWLKATNPDALICFAYGASDAACEFAPSDIDAAIDAAIRKG